MHVTCTSHVPLTQHQTSSVEAKWENITMALEPFQVEPSLDPDQQYLVKRLQTKELDSAIGDIEKQIEDLEVSKGCGFREWVWSLKKSVRMC